MNIDFDKHNGLVPAIVQDDGTGDVLMVGYMNREALDLTLSGRKVTFWSRSRKRRWKKGEASGNELDLVSVLPDCDNDALLIRAIPTGPVCHTGKRSCFGESSVARRGVVRRLEEIVHDRKQNPKEGSYTSGLFMRGGLRIAQKVGEEAVETILAATGADTERTVSEAADLVYHLTVLLAENGIGWEDVESELERRMT